jgi:hypothetical protein
VNEGKPDGIDAAPISYRIDSPRRMVHIRVRENIAAEDVVKSYASILGAPEYEPGFSLVVNRQGLSEPPSAETVRAVIAYLRSHAAETGACRMAVVTDEQAPRSAWRAAEMLADHYTSVQLRVFDDQEAAELWAQGM